jgi:2,3-dihydroxybenzoate-AMP ligase
MIARRFQMIDGAVPWPADVVAYYRGKGLWQDRNLGNLLREWAQAHGERTALVDGEVRLSYAELDGRTNTLAAGLLDLGLAAGDRIVLHLPNGIDFFVTLFACLKAGVLPILALPAHRRNEIEYLCRHAEARAYVIPDRHEHFDYQSLAKEVQAAVPCVAYVLVAGEHDDYTALRGLAGRTRSLSEPDAGDVAFFLLSGGTTGLPKLIPRTHNDYLLNLKLASDNAQLDERSVYFAALPVAHNYALGCPGVLGVLAAGGTAVLATQASPEDALPLMNRHGVTVTGLVPALAILWMDAVEAGASPPPTLDLVQVGGSRFSDEAARRFRRLFPCRLQQSFGMAEGLLCQTRYNDPDEVVTTTQGRPLSAADEICIVDDHDKPVAPGEIGHLLTRGPYTIRGYYRAPAYNDASFTADGFYRSGDLIRLTADGNVVVEGRVKDVINRGGDKIPVEDVESHLLAHPAVRETALVSVPDPIMGERSCAYVVPRGERPKPIVLARFLHDKGLAPFKIPDRFEIVDALPRTALGKVNKSELRKRAAEKNKPTST